MTEVGNKTSLKISEKRSGRTEKKKMSVRKAHTIILCVILAVCVICAVFQLTNSASITIRANSVFTADGKNPDGTPFSIMELFNDEIMQNASEKLNGKLSAGELRNHLTVSDTMTRESFDKLEQSIFDGEDENTYFPAEYQVTYSTVSEQIRSEGFFAQCESLWNSIFLPTKTKILNAVRQSYQEYYAETYLNYDGLFEIDWTVVDSMDYYNRFAFMDDTVQRLMRFLQYKNSISVLQSGADTAGSYYDLIAELSKGAMHGVENYQAYVTQNGVTNAKEELLRQFVYMQRLCEEENARKLQEYEVLKKAIEKYDSTTTKVVFIPALDENQSFYMNRTNIGLDYLSEKADAAKLLADSAKYSSKQYSYLQTCFGVEYIIDESGNKIQIKNTATQRAHADELYETLKKEIRQMTEKTALLTMGEDETVRKELKVSKPFCDANLLCVGMNSAKTFAVLVMVAYVAIYVTAVISRKKQKEQGACER